MSEPPSSLPRLTLAACCGRRKVQRFIFAAAIGLAFWIPAFDTAAQNAHSQQKKAPAPPPPRQSSAPAAAPHRQPTPMPAEQPTPPAPIASPPAVHPKANPPATTPGTHAPATTKPVGHEKNGTIIKPVVPVGIVAIRASNEKELLWLAQAYRLLWHADHDYNGHRIAAMREVAAAAALLGGHLGGDGGAGESQFASDLQLQEASGLLTQVSSLAAARVQPGVLNHVDAAIGQISIALSIR